MRTSEQIDKIAAALIEAKSKIGTVKMSGYNKFDKYPYATLNDYLSAVKPALTEHGLMIITGASEIVPQPPRTTNAGKTDNAVLVKLTLRLLHSSGQWIEIDQWGEGQDRGDKGTYQAVTGARKYGIANLLCLFTSEDPEAIDKGGRDKDSNGPSANVAPARKADDLL